MRTVSRLLSPRTQGAVLTKLAKSALLLAIIALIAASAHAQTLSGTAKADSAGKFSFKLADAGGPHLLRAVHQGVNYHQMAPPGTSHVEVKVYDVSQKIDGLSLTADVLRLQADKTSLQGIRLFAVDNASSPAVTQMNDHNFEFYLPAGAKVAQVQAKAPNGQPIPAEAVPQSAQ